jgi:hypothetical protein
MELFQSEINFMSLCHFHSQETNLEVQFAKIIITDG